mmetsp:Transcript_18066/g.30219  ORF Transcript_18066/g.30219 Transcript_18066/m.30219 type:complete len:245 (-) Transcript_18066:1174-1908(-)
MMILSCELISIFSNYNKNIRMHHLCRRPVASLHREENSSSLDSKCTLGPRPCDACSEQPTVITLPLWSLTLITSFPHMKVTFFSPATSSPSSRNSPMVLSRGSLLVTLNFRHSALGPCFNTCSNIVLQHITNSFKLVPDRPPSPDGFQDMPADTAATCVKANVESLSTVSTLSPKPRNSWYAQKKSHESNATGSQISVTISSRYGCRALATSSPTSAPQRPKSKPSFWSRACTSLARAFSSLET